MKKNFILFALMVFLPILAFAQQNVRFQFSTSERNPGTATVTYDGQAINLRGYYSVPIWGEQSLSIGGTSNGHARTTVTKNGEAVALGAIKDAGTYSIRHYEGGRWRNQQWQNGQWYYGTVTINPLNLEEANLEFEGVDNAIYNRKAWYPTKINITVGEGDAKKIVETLTYSEPQRAIVSSYSGDETSVDIEDNIYPGTATVTVAALNANDVPTQLAGNYTGSVEGSFPIAAKSIEDLTIAFEKTPNFTYNGKVQQPKVVVKDGDEVLEAGEEGEYTVDIPESVNAGDYTATVIFDGYRYVAAEPAVVDDPQGQDEEEVPTVELDYSIAKKALTDAMLTIYGPFTYDTNVHPTENEFEVVDEDLPEDIQDILAEVDYPTGDELPKDAGKYDFTVTAKEDGNYSGSITKRNVIVIDRQAIVINAAQLWKWYGEKDSEARSTVTGDAVHYVDFTIDGNSGTTALIPEEKAHILKYLDFIRVSEGEDAGTYDYMVAAKPDMTGCNYAIQIQHNTSKLVIRPRAITVSVNDPLVVNVDNTWKYYKENDPKFTPVLIEGELQYDDKIADVVTITREGAGTVEGEAVGTYAFTATSANYDVTLVNEAFEIKERPNSTASLEYNSTVFDGRYKTPKVTVKSKVNNVEVILEENKDYTVEYDNNRNVTDFATATVIFNEANFPNEANKTLRFKITKRNLHVKVQSFSDETGAQNTNYNVEPNSKKINFIYYDSFGVKADNYSKSENKEDVEGEGFERPTVTLIKTDDPTKYNLQVNGGSAKNYNLIADNTGVLTVLRAKFLQITISGEKYYGDADPKFVVKAKGWELDETTAQQDAILKPNGTDYAFKMVRDEGEDAGNYGITITGPSVLGNEGTGYNVEYIDGGFTIKPRPLIITADNTSKTYGDADPVPYPVTIGDMGLANGDTKEDILSFTFTYTAWEGTWPFLAPVERTVTVPVYDVTRVEGENAGDYNLTGIAPNRWARYNENLNNYDITWTVFNDKGVNNKLTINKKALTIYPIDGEKVYGEPDPDFAETNVKVEGLQFDETPAEVLKVNGHYIYKVTRNLGEAAGTYTLTIADNKVNDNEVVPFKLTNYTYTYNPTTAKFVIKQKPLIVKALDQTIPYATEINKYYIAIGTVNQDGSISYVNKKADDILANNDKVKDVIELSTDITKVGTHDPSENPYKYTLKSANYSIAEEDFVQGYLTIGKLPYLPLDERDLAKLTGKSIDVLPLSQVIKDHDGATLDVYLPGRSMIMEQWYTFVLPFDIRVSKLSKALDYAVVDMLDETTSGSFNFQTAMANIPANTPFLVQVADNNKGEAQMRSIKIEKQLIKYAEEAVATDASGDYKFVGSYDSFKGLESNQLRMKHTSPTVDEKFVRGDAKSSIRETEAWLEIPADVEFANVRIYIQEPDGSTTAINGVAEEGADVAAEGWYTINGVKLEGEPTVSGTYIFNGKKVFIQK